ncbi:hypothetical protein [Cardinium endosymbiont of Tipula unca]|uniref:hypothetical protein n=1 Tax=Cardinium endosymbiont of Tipula unca TaxID=3066216 RepID=UPI0030CC6B81
MLFCSIKGANRGYIQVLLATSRNRIYFRRRSIHVRYCSIYFKKNLDTKSEQISAINALFIM